MCSCLASCDECVNFNSDVRTQGIAFVTFAVSVPVHRTHPVFSVALAGRALTEFTSSFPQYCISPGDTCAVCISQGPHLAKWNVYFTKWHVESLKNSNHVVYLSRQVYSPIGYLFFRYSSLGSE